MKANFSLISLTIVAVFTLFVAANCGGEGKKPAETVQNEEAPVASADTEKGKELFTQNGCAGCHGETGLGDGPAGQALNPKPRNFTHTSEYKQGSSVEDITKTIETGIPGTAMVAYPHIPEGDRKLIAEYIVSLQK